MIGAAAYYSSEQDATIARVALAGWKIVERPEASTQCRYVIFGPDGTAYGTAPTRYNAACRAELYIWDILEIKRGGAYHGGNRRET